MYDVQREYRVSNIELVFTDSRRNSRVQFVVVSFCRALEKAGERKSETRNESERPV